MIEITCEKSDLGNIIASDTQLNPDEQKFLPGLLNVFERLFDGMLGEWDAHPLYLDLKTVSNTLNVRCYNVSMINKYNLIKEPIHLV